MVLNVAHAWTWAILYNNVGVNDIPPKVTWIESVEVLNAWRKELKTNPDTERFTLDRTGEKNFTIDDLVELGMDKQLLDRLELDHD